VAYCRYQRWGHTRADYFSNKGNAAKCYKTVRQHLKVLEKNKIIMPVGSGYGITYLLSTEMEENFVEFEKIWERVGKAKKMT